VQQMAPRGIPVMAGTAPLAERPLAAGKRLPHLAAIDDADERRAALANADEVMAALSNLGARYLLVNLGQLSLSSGTPGALVEHFTRGEAPDPSDGGTPLALALAERRARTAAVLDA